MWPIFKEGEPCFVEAFQIFTYYVTRAHTLGVTFAPFDAEDGADLEGDLLQVRADGAPVTPATDLGGFIVGPSESVIALGEVSALLGYLQHKGPQPTELTFTEMARLGGERMMARTLALPTSGLDMREPLFLFGAAVEANLDALEAIIDGPTSTPDEIKRHRLAVFAKMARNAAFHDNLLSFLPPKKHAPLGQWAARWTTYTIRIDVQKGPKGCPPIVHGFDAEQGGNLLDGRTFVGDYMWPLAPLLLLWEVKELLLGR